MALHRAPSHAAASPVTAQRIARCAVRALHAEVALEPKPGLVSFRDNGSHSDMTAAT
ncbi:MAG: triphosphoribosyl-dephospho-CoA synthase, partial [Rhodoferax sp.]|nr:triphosphoribosyl-dephospho-CoA synthase [Rhodoferax sp.]